jgi:hypothetical protein
MAGLPSETVEIAARTLNYLEQNAKPLIHPGDEFLASFTKEESHYPMIDYISEIRVEEEEIEDLREVVDIEVDDEENIEEKFSVPQLNPLILPDKEKRKMDKVQVKAEKEAERARKKSEREALKAEKGKEKADRKMRAVVAKLRPLELSASAEG